MQLGYTDGTSDLNVIDLRNGVVNKQKPVTFEPSSLPTRDREGTGGGKLQKG